MTSPKAALRLIRQEFYDVWIDCDPWSRINVFLSFFSHASYRIGFRTQGQYRHFIYDSVVNHSKECHEVENYRHLASLIGSVA